MTHYADWLKNKLVNVGMTQTDLANKLKVNRSMVSNWICGRHHPDLKNQLLILVATKAKKKDFVAMLESLLADNENRNV